MQDNYLISVIGTQVVDGEEDTIELTTTAAYTEKNGKKIIKYKEYADDGSNAYTTNVLKIESRKVTITKMFDKSSQLILEPGERHQCVYSTPIGSMAIGVYTEDMSCSVDENGGKLEVSYTIDFNSDFESYNRIEIILTKKENT